MKDAHPWKLYTPPGMCSNVMYVCYSILQMDCDNAQLAAIDIKALADVDTGHHIALCPAMSMLILMVNRS